MFQLVHPYNRRSERARIRALMSSQHNGIHKLLMKMRLFRKIVCGAFISTLLSFFAWWLENQLFFLIVSAFSFTCCMFLLPCYIFALFESKMALGRQPKEQAEIEISKKQIIDAY
jgi:hypothetical protein